MTLKVIRLELARTKDHPEGDPNHAYVFRAPLTPDGHLDSDKFKEAADLCSAVKFVPDEGIENGRLIRTRGGWAFSYAAGDEDDEPIFRLGSHVFREGEYVTITEHDETPRPFRVVSIRDLK